MKPHVQHQQLQMFWQQQNQEMEQLNGVVTFSFFLNLCSCFSLCFLRFYCNHKLFLNRPWLLNVEKSSKSELLMTHLTGSFLLSFLYSNSHTLSWAGDYLILSVSVLSVSRALAHLWKLVSEGVHVSESCSQWRRFDEIRLRVCKILS